MSMSIKIQTRVCLAFVCLKLFASSQDVFCEMTASVHRSEAEQEEHIQSSSSRGFLAGILDNLLNFPDRPNSDGIGTPNCFTCNALGDSRDFNAPLYDHCDVVLLNTLFDENFTFDIYGQSSILVSDDETDTDDSSASQSSSASTTIGPERGTISLHFEPTPGITLPSISTSTHDSAPSFRAIFTGINNGTEYVNALSCVLLPSQEPSSAQASCNGYLTSLVDAGIVPDFTQFQSGLATLQVYTLTFKRNTYCVSDFLSLVGSGVRPGVLAPGFGFPSGQFSVNQQTLVTGIRVFRKFFPPPPPSPPTPPPNAPPTPPTSMSTSALEP